ncbi:MAG: phosphatase PAP2 family protein, partial [Mycobacteriaceae bacterium]
MDSVIVAVAKYLLYLMVIAFALVWVFREDGRGKLDLAGAAVIGLILVGMFIVIAGAVHDDPRPFMQDPSLNNMLHHAPGNGFPSDHSCAAGLIAGLVALRHRLYGAILAVAAILVAAARVAAHAHHVQDVVAGLALGALAAWLGTLLATW